MLNLKTTQVFPTETITAQELYDLVINNGKVVLMTINKSGLVQMVTFTHRWAAEYTTTGTFKSFCNCPYGLKFPHVYVGKANGQSAESSLWDYGRLMEVIMKVTRSRILQIVVTTDDIEDHNL